MLLIVSTVFLLFNIPSHAVRVYIFFESSLDFQYQPGHLLVLVQKMTMHLFNASFATNFILYSLSGRAFRRATVRLAQIIGHRGTTWIRWLIRDGRRGVVPRPRIDLGRFGGGGVRNGYRQAGNEPQMNCRMCRPPAAAVYALATPGAQVKLPGGSGSGSGGGPDQAREVIVANNPFN
jgi:hypothetical protein